MSVTLITGCAGSGKSTHCKKVEDQYDIKIYHDEWVSAQYFGNKTVQRHMMNIFPQAHCNLDINKRNIIKWLKEEPKLNILLKNYWMVAYCNMISAALIRYRSTDVKILMECPFLDDNIKALKEIYGDELTIKWVATPENILIRLKDRNWSNLRIANTIGNQSAEYNKYKHIVDECI